MSVRTLKCLTPPTITSINTSPAFHAEAYAVPPVPFRPESGVAGSFPALPTHTNTGHTGQEPTHIIPIGTGYVAAEANHAKFKKLEKELRQLCSRIADVLESYTDEPDRSAY